MAPINKAVIEELVSARKVAQDYAAAFSDAIKHQAQIHRLERAALRAYVCALADDRVRDLAELADQLTALIDEDQPDLFPAAPDKSEPSAEIAHLWSSMDVVSRE